MTCAAVYEMNGVSLDGETHWFRKPWFMTTLMFIGMSFCLPLAYLEERNKNKRERMQVHSDGDEPLLSGDHGNGVRFTSTLARQLCLHARSHARMCCASGISVFAQLFTSLAGWPYGSAIRQAAGMSCAPGNAGALYRRSASRSGQSGGTHSC